MSAHVFHILILAAFVAGGIALYLYAKGCNPKPQEFKRRSEWRWSADARE